MAYEYEMDFVRPLFLEDAKTEYDFWKEAFPLLYNGSIEEVAAREAGYVMLKSLR
jgi:hypothetical protein